MKRWWTVMMIVAALVLVGAGCSKGKTGDADSGKSSGDTEQGSTAKGSSSTGGSSTGGQGAKLGGDIRQGMSFDDVVAKLGDPTAQYGANADGKELLQCVWEKDGTTVMVQFHDNKVFAVHRGAGSDEANPVDAAQVKKNFSKVRIGMSEDEVIGLLGTPTNSTGWGDGNQSSATKTWEVDGMTYGVVFVNGKVQTTVKNQD
jgi:hypothetical protein